MSDAIGGNGGVGQSASNGTPVATASGPPPPGQKRPLGAVITSAIDGTRILVRKQVELAKIEMTEAVAVRAKGAGVMAGAAVMALFALGFVAAAGSVALALVLPAWAANLIVALVFVAIAGVLVLMVGMLLGTTVLTFLALRRFRSKRSASAPAAEVVVRIVREDL